MAQLRSTKLAQLLSQAKYAPQEQRIIQIDACETLIRLIRPGAEYPYEFICFHLTGYRPKGEKSSKLIKYQTLIHDLPLYSEQMSKTVRVYFKDIKAKKKPLTIAQISQKFQVCPKTISRWRRHGLMGRFLVYPDGRLRLAFLSNTVDYFVNTHRKRVEKSSSFRQSDVSEREAIIKRLVRWSRTYPDQRQQAIRRTAKKFKRSTETVRSILATHEKEIHPQRLFEKRDDYIDADKRAQIGTLFEQGASIAKLMDRFGRSKSNIYRAINLHGAQELNQRKISFMPADEFDETGRLENILTPPPGLFDVLSTRAVSLDKDKPVTQVRIPSIPRQPLSDLGAYSVDIAQSLILGQKQEHFLFRKYNYLKYLSGRLQIRIKHKQPQGKLIRQAREYLSQAERVKEILISCNLRLVVSIARKHTRSDAEMMELISEGNIALMNAVEKFDFTRGIKFSTYATWAIVKRFATLRTTQSRQPARAASEELMEVDHDLRVADSRVVEVESARRSLYEVMEDTLEEREKVIVREHYGLLENEKVPGQRKAKSLSQIARLVGLSKEGVRKIELAALQKLRRVMSPEEFEVLVGG